MLVLSRDRNQKIVINDNIVITVLSTDHRGQVRIGIEAPREISIHRQEIHDKIKAGNDNK